MKFNTTPQIMIELIGFPRKRILQMFDEIDGSWNAEDADTNSFCVDVDVAEKAVAWLKAHDVGQMRWDGR